MDSTRAAFRGHSRRGFLVSAMAAPLIVPAAALGRGGRAANDRITIGIIGSGNRAMFEARHLVPIEDCEIVAVCDAQETRRTGAKATFEKLYAERKQRAAYAGIRMYRDFRELLARKDIDAVYIVTPDHWHVPMLISALKAGKAVHQEKPLGISVEQDLAALKAVRKYKRPFFYGPERRSAAEARHAIELVLNGRIGKVKEIWVAAPPSKSGGALGTEPVPEGFDYDIWLGPAPQAPFSKARVSEGIFHIMDYCLGFISNWGVHPMDQVQWWADNAGRTIPVSYEGSGRRAEGGLYNCAVQWDLKCTYEDGLVMRYMDGNTFNQRTDLPQDVPLGPPGKRGMNAAIFIGTEGVVANCYEKIVTAPASLLTSEIKPNEIHLQQSPAAVDRVTGKGVWEYPAAAHQLAWIESLRSGKPGVHSIETAVYSDLICQLSDICIRTKHPVRWDPKTMTVTGEAEARKLMRRPMRKPWDILA